MIVVAKGYICFAELAVPLDINIVITVNHDLRYAGIGQERVNWSITKNFIGHILNDLLLIGLREVTVLLLQQL